MKLSKIHLFFFVLLCAMASVMSVQFQPSMTANHHGGGVGCYGRRPRPNGNGGGTDGGNNNNNQTNGGNTNGQNGETEQI